MIQYCKFDCDVTLWRKLLEDTGTDLGSHSGCSDSDWVVLSNKFSSIYCTEHFHFGFGY